MGTAYIQLANRIRKVVEAGNKVLIAGNGGSASQADHFACELIADAWPCISLTNPAIVTALGNDYGFEHVFSYQVAALGKKGDILILLTTSGKSWNILRNIPQSQIQGIDVYVVGGKLPKQYASFADNIVLYGEDAQEIQESTLNFLHKLWKEL